MSEICDLFKCCYASCDTETFFFFFNCFVSPVVSSPYSIIPFLINFMFNQEQEPKRKRAKVVSACNECRRKKTKCDGEQPCRGCYKSNANNCVYKSVHLNLNNNNNDDIDNFANEKRNSNVTISNTTLESIEMRLKVIEDLLKIVLEQQQQEQQQLASSASSTCSSPFREDTHRLPSIQSLSKPFMNNNDDYHLPLFNPLINIHNSDSARHSSRPTPVLPESNYLNYQHSFLNKRKR